MSLSNVSESPHETLATSIFSVFAGLSLGPPVAVVCCWLTDQFDYVWHAALIGLPAGAVTGILVAYIFRTLRREPSQLDTATTIGIVFGFVPSLLLGLQGVGMVRGRLSGFLLAGAVFAGPMAGLLIGGMLDRAWEAQTKRKSGEALAFTLAAVATCVGIVFTFDSLAYGPDPARVTAEAKALITAEWKKNPPAPDATINDVILVRNGRKTYTGTVDAAVAGQPQHLLIDVTIEGPKLSLQLHPPSN